MVLIHELKTGSFQVRYKLANYLSETFNIEATDGISATYHRLLTPSHNVTLKISRTFDGTPLSDMSVKLVALEPTIMIQAEFTNAEGEVTFDDVASKTYLIQLS